MPDHAQTEVSITNTLKISIHGRGKKAVAYALVLDDPCGRYSTRQLWYLNGWGYPQTTVSSPGVRAKTVKLHQLVYRYYHGPQPEGTEIDHKDQKKLNCLPEKVRAVSRSINQANKGKQQNNKSGFKGVCLRCDKWPGL